MQRFLIIEGNKVFYKINMLQKIKCNLENL